MGQFYGLWLKRCFVMLKQPLIVHVHFIHQIFNFVVSLGRIVSALFSLWVHFVLAHLSLKLGSFGWIRSSEKGDLTASLASMLNKLLTYVLLIFCKHTS